MSFFCFGPEILFLEKLGLKIKWDGWGVVDSHQGVGGGTGGGFYLIVSCLFVLLSFGVSCPVSF